MPCHPAHERQTVTTLKYIFDIFYFVYTRIACIIAIQTGGKRGWRARHQRTLDCQTATAHHATLLYIPIYLVLTLAVVNYAIPVRMCARVKRRKQRAAHFHFLAPCTLHLPPDMKYENEEIPFVHTKCVLNVQRIVHSARLSLCIPSCALTRNACRSHSSHVPFGRPRHMSLSLFPQSRTFQRDSVRARAPIDISFRRKRCHERKKDKCTRSRRFDTEIGIAKEVDGYRGARQTDRIRIFIATRIQTTDSYIFGPQLVREKSTCQAWAWCWWEGGIRYARRRNNWGSLSFRTYL